MGNPLIHAQLTTEKMRCNMKFIKWVLGIMLATSSMSAIDMTATDYNSLLVLGSNVYSGTMSVTAPNSNTKQVSTSYTIPVVGDKHRIWFLDGLGQIGGLFTVPSTGTWWWVSFDSTQVPFKMAAVDVEIFCNCYAKGNSGCEPGYTSSGVAECYKTSCTDMECKLDQEDAVSEDFISRGGGVIMRATTLIYNGVTYQ